MGFVGGDLGYRFLKKFYPGGQNVPMSSGDPYKERGQSKLATLFGPEIFEELADKVVLDFGCGEGSTCIELAQRRSSEVIGLDNREDVLAIARSEAERCGVAGRCRFVSSLDTRVDVVLSMDAFEHFADPAGVLVEMRRLLEDSGYALIQFGYPWYHPLGGHLFSVFPWAHLIFTEEALIRWRSDFKTDGARRFHEVAGGLNQMTIARWERLVKESPFRVATQELVPIRSLRHFHNRLTRELFTSLIRARLVPREPAKQP